MASRYRWRQRLLGSLQGQPQLATYLVVFLDFTGASSVGLLIGQRNLLANDQQLARQSIALCDKAIRGLQTTQPGLNRSCCSTPAPTPASGLVTPGDANQLEVHYATTTTSTIRTSFYATLTPEALAWCP